MGGGRDREQMRVWVLEGGLFPLSLSFYVYPRIAYLRRYIVVLSTAVFFNLFQFAEPLKHY